MAETRRCPGWFRACFVVVMLAVCVWLALCTVDQARLRAKVDDLTVSLEQSRGREARQTYEYNEAAAALPLAQEALAEIAPKTEQAQARETELRQERKTVRAENAALEEQLALKRAELDKLREQAEELLGVTEEIQSILQVP